MAESIGNILTYDELELYIKTLKPSKIEDLGSTGWYEAHQRLQKLNQQAIFDLKNIQEENVKDLFNSYGKTPILVYEAICIQVWREKVFPEIINKCPTSPNMFMLYVVLFHEATVISILECGLFHPDSCEALDDSAIDLIDYCALAITKLVGYKDDSERDPKEVRTTKQDLEEQEKQLDFVIGMRCISLVFFMASQLENLPLSVSTRMYTTHDIPLLLTTIRERPPWTRKDKKGNTLIFEDGRWQPIYDESSSKLVRVEGQLWLALHQLLLNPRCQAHYEINDHRKNQLIKLQRFLTDVVLDQVSPLLDLKHWLSQVAMSNLPPPSKRPVVLEVVPEIRSKLLDRSSKKWKQIARQQASENFFTGDKDKIMSVAKSLCETYNLDVLEALEPTVRRCSGCGDETTQRCSRCKTYYYCSRPCQVKNWPTHKPHCDKIYASVNNIGDHN